MRGTPEQGTQTGRERPVDDEETMHMTPQDNLETSPVRGESHRRRSFPGRWRTTVVLALGALGLGLGPAHATGETLAESYSLATEITYRGDLREDGRPAEGVYDVGFELWDSPEGGTFLGRVDAFDLEVRAGVLSAPLDFGVHVFGAETYFLQLFVRPAGAGAYTRLEPRRTVTGSLGTCVIDQDVEIQGDLTVDPPSGSTDLTVACCNDLDQGGQLRLDGFLGQLLLDSNEIQSSALGTPAALSVNPQGGDVAIGVTTAAAPVSLPDGPDVTPSSGGALVLGSPSGANLALDANEIMARNAGAVAPLALNFNGGDVRVGGALDIGLERVVLTSGMTTIDLACPAGKHILSGGCSTPSRVEKSFPLSSTAWRCEFEANNVNNTAVAICARVRWLP